MNSTRPVTDLEPKQIKALAYGVFPAYAMIAGMELDLFTPLDAKPCSASELAEHLSLPVARLEILLNALVAANLLVKNNDVFSNTTEASEFLVKGKPNYMGSMHKFYSGLWKAVAKTAHSIRADKPIAKRDWGSDKTELLQFFNAQYHSSLAAGKQLCQLLDLQNNCNLLDVGGGSGGVSIALCEYFPRLHSTIVDLPGVIEVTPEFTNQSSTSERIKLVGIDLCEKPLKPIYDVAIMRNLIQVLGPDQAQAILNNTYQSLVEGAKLFIVGRILDNSRLGPASAVAHSLVFLNTYDQGQAYTQGEYFAWLEAAGFKNPTITFEAANDGSTIISAEK